MASTPKVEVVKFHYSPGPSHPHMKEEYWVVCNEGNPTFINDRGERNLSLSPSLQAWSRNGERTPPSRLLMSYKYLTSLRVPAELIEIGRAHV